MMEYRLLDTTKRGFMLTRKPEIVEGELVISFSAAPPSATAIFENGNGNSLYRLIEDGACSVPADFLTGTVKLTVTALNGRNSAPKFVCEEIFTERKNGVLIVCPNGLDIPLQIIEIFSQMQDIREEMSALNERQDELGKKLDKLLDGYDFD